MNKPKENVCVQLLVCPLCWQVFASADGCLPGHISGWPGGRICEGPVLRQAYVLGGPQIATLKPVGRGEQQG